MSDEVIRCSKCGGTVSGETCTACGAEGQAIKCEHCGALCPADARWCPACGKHLSASTGNPKAAENTVPPGGNSVRLVLLLALVVVACVLILKLAPQPAALAAAALAVAAALVPALPLVRLRRAASILGGAALAAVGVSFLAPSHFTSPQPFVAPQPVPVQSMGAAPEFVPGKLIVRFKDGGLDSNVAVSILRAMYYPGLAGLRGPGAVFTPVETINSDTHDVIIDFSALNSHPETTVLYRFAPDRAAGISGEAYVRARAFLTVGDVVAAFQSDPDVVFAEPDYIYHTLYTPNDQWYDKEYDGSKDRKLSQWYLPKISAPAAFDRLKGKQTDIRVAIIDTGVDFKHPDLENKLAHDSKGKVVGKNFISPSLPPVDDNGHGTHCAGIAAAETDNSIGIAGVSFNSVKIVPAKVMTAAGFGQMGWICSAITWCADQGCRVESLSLGGGQYSQAMQDAINYAWSKGTIVVAAAGNAATARPGYPAGCNHAVAVSATDQADKLAYFSNYGTPIAIGAPGVEILSTMPTYPCDLTKKRGYKENYDGLSGTSMACPVVSGALGALLAYQPSLTPDEAVTRLEQTADNVAGSSGGWDMYFGYGRVNLDALLADRKREAATGSLYGQVINKQKFAVPNASVRCGGVAIVTKTDGMFRFPNLKPGSHTVEVTLQKKTITVDANVIQGADENLTIDLSKAGQDR